MIYTDLNVQFNQFRKAKGNAHLVTVPEESVRKEIQK